MLFDKEESVGRRMLMKLLLIKWMKKGIVLSAAGTNDYDSMKNNRSDYVTFLSEHV